MFEYLKGLMKDFDLSTGDAIFLTVASIICIGVVTALLFIILREEYKDKKVKGQTRASSFFDYLREKSRQSKVEIPPKKRSELVEKFNCLKCSDKRAYLEICSTPLEDTLSKLLNIDNVSFAKLSCEKCGFTELYSYNAVCKREPIWEDDARSNEEYLCSKCANKKGKEISIAVVGIGLERSKDIHSGRYKAIYCDDCGYAEVYEIQNPFTRPWGSRLVDELNKLTRDFKCIKCFHKSGDSTVAGFTGGWFSRAANIQYIDLIMVNCENCKYVEIYERTIRAGENIFAIR